jgi:hypothetical protein
MSNVTLIIAKALNIYERELNVEQPLFAHKLPGGASSFLVNEPSRLTEGKLEQLMGRMRCLKGLGEWRRLHHSCQDMLHFFVGSEGAKAVASEPVLGLASEHAPTLLHTSQSAQNVAAFLANPVKRQPSVSTLAGVARAG